MCTSPISIKNSYYGKDPSKGYNFLHNCSISQIQVGCGHCGECIAIKQMNLIQRVQMEALKNHLFMVTLSYQNDMLPRLETSQGYLYRYADMKEFQLMVKRLQENNTLEVPWRYVVVSERGTEFGRPHLHALILIEKDSIGRSFNDALHFEQIHKFDFFNEWKRNIGTRNSPIYKPLSKLCYSYRGNKLRCTYDFHYVIPSLTSNGVTEVAFYVLKYMLKGGDYENRIRQALFLNYDGIEAKKIWDTIKSKEFHSKGFGLNSHIVGNCNNRFYKPDDDIISYLHECIEKSKKQLTYDYPLYYCPESINIFPLADYYRNNNAIFTIKDQLDFFYRSNNSNPDNWKYQDERAYNLIQSSISRYRKVLNLQKNDTFTDLDDSFYD